MKSIVVIDTDSGMVKDVFGSVPAKIAILDTDLRNSRGLPILSLNYGRSCCVYHTTTKNRHELVETVERKLGKFINAVPCPTSVNKARKPIIIVETHAGHIRRLYSNCRLHVVILDSNLVEDCILSFDERSFNRNVRWYQHVSPSVDYQETERLRLVKKYLGDSSPGKQRKNKFLCADKSLPDPGLAECVRATEKAYQNMLRSSRAEQFCVDAGEAIQDYITDLMHLSHSLNVSLDDLMITATANFMEEMQPRYI